MSWRSFHRRVKVFVSHSGLCDPSPVYLIAAAALRSSRSQDFRLPEGATEDGLNNVALMTGFTGTDVIVTLRQADEIAAVGVALVNQCREALTLPELWAADELVRAVAAFTEFDEVRAAERDWPRRS